MVSPALICAMNCMIRREKNDSLNNKRAGIANWGEAINTLHLFRCIINRMSYRMRTARTLANTRLKINCITAETTQIDKHITKH